MKIAISGAGVAGTTLAYWLLKAGHEPVLIEEWPELRTGGYLVDFWGLGYDVAEKMGLEQGLLASGYQPEEVRFVDGQGRKVGGFSTQAMRELAGRFVSIRRGEIVRLVFEALGGRVETVFGDRIAALEEGPDGVAVTLAKGGTRDFDLVIGADGLHSAVRALRFAPEDSYETYLGYAVAAFEVEGYKPRDEGIYVIRAAASHQAARFALREDRTLFLFVFRCDPSKAGAHLTKPQIRDLLQSEFHNLGWELQEILDALDGIDDIYFDRMSQIRMPHWHRGRIALLGDAAAAVSLLAGEGTGLAMTEAYIMAGELLESKGDYRIAFQSYERRLFPFLEQKQKAARDFASVFVPRTDLGVWFRNQATKLMNIPGVSNLFLGKSLTDGLELPTYSF